MPRAYHARPLASRHFMSALRAPGDMSALHAPGDH
jgi:hypothetical protein